MQHCWLGLPEGPVRQAFFTGVQPQVSGQMERLKTARGNDYAFCSALHLEVVSVTLTTVLCGLIGESMGLLCFGHSLGRKLLE